VFRGTGNPLFASRKSSLDFWSEEGSLYSFLKFQPFSETYDMDKINLAVSPRDRSGSGAAGRLRREGKVPAVVYGASGTRNVVVERGPFLQVWREAGQSSVVNIDDGNGGEMMTLIQDAQRDPLSGEFVHVDFLELTKGHVITAHIPVHVHGSPKGVRVGGGVLDIQLHEIEVRCLPSDLPHQIDIDVSGLDLGESLHIADLPKLSGVEYMGDDDQPVAGVSHPVTEDDVPDEDGAEDVEPEVITAKKTADEDDGEESGK